MPPSSKQLSIIEAPLLGSIFLHGPAGTGKTTAGTGRLSFLLQSGIPAHQILLLLPQRTLDRPYLEVYTNLDLPGGTTLTSTTLGGIARRMIALFWPMILEKDIFPSHPPEPVFLTLESAQYYLAHLVRPLIVEKGFFDSVTIQRNRIYSQILDNLNKAAVIGFPSAEISSRLTSSWVGDPGRTRVYQDAQHCVQQFREFCLENGLLDYSLQMEIFTRVLWPIPKVKDYLRNRYRHLIYDNLEEDVPVTHDILEEWLPSFDSSLMIFDELGGYRQFLGADPESGSRFAELADRAEKMSSSKITSQELNKFGFTLRRVIADESVSGKSIPGPRENFLELGYQQFYPDMLRWAVDNVSKLIDSGIPPGEIAVLAPFVSESLRFSLGQLFQEQGIDLVTHRPSRALRDQPITRCLLTLAAIAHPQWLLQPTDQDVTHAFLQAFPGLDLIRAQLLSTSVFIQVPDRFQLADFEDVSAALRERITYAVGSKYQFLKDWLRRYQESPMSPLDHFYRRLFGEVLSKPGFGFHESPLSGSITAKLIESVEKFRKATSPLFHNDHVLSGREYVQMVQEGVIASQYISDWHERDEEAVYLAPAFTFLMKNSPVSYQFWLDGGSRGWYERIYQPLTHPYVLSRHWQTGTPWTDQDEVKIRREVLQKITSGLIQRCREKIFLGYTAVDQRGYDQKGMLLEAVNRVLMETENLDSHHGDLAQ